MAVYCCVKCSTLVERERVPFAGGCPAGGLHRWVKVCSRGSLVPKPGLGVYQCFKCGLSVYCADFPNGSGCPAGGNHLWKKL